MQRFLHNTASKFTVLFVNNDGNAITPTQVDWILRDDAEQQVTTGQSIAPGGTELTVDIAAIDNQVVAAEVRSARWLNVVLTVADGSTYTQNTYYLVELESILVIGDTSYMTYMDALRLVPDFPSFVAWGSATEQQQKSALTAAYYNIGQMSLHQGSISDDTIIGKSGDVIAFAADIAPASFALLKTVFLKDLKMAQLVEAEHLLGADGVENLRRKGVLSYTVGEVKKFFRTRKPLEWLVSKQALVYIGKYVRYNQVVYRG